MGIPTFKLSTDTTATNYANSTGSKLIIKSELFDNHKLEFLAYLTDMSQNFASTWNTENLFGRNDPVGIFQGTVRTISLSFNVVAGTLEEAILNTDKLGVLASFLYPSYKQNTGKAIDELGNVQIVPTGTSHMYGSPLVRVKFANLIDNNMKGGGDGLLGWIGSLSISPVLDNGTFIIGSHGDAKHYPKTFDISFDLNVLHDRTPGFDQDSNWQGYKHFFGGQTRLTQGVNETLEDFDNDEYNSSFREPTPEEAAADSERFINDPFGVSERNDDDDGTSGNFS